MKAVGKSIKILLATSQTIVTYAGYLAGLLSFLLVLMIVIDVGLRYVAGETSVWIVELEWHVFSLIFLLGGAYTLQSDGHVRVDVFLQRLNESNRRWVNLAGHVFLLIPFCLFMIPPAWDYFYQSWSISEASGDPGGLPALYPIKAFIPLAFILLFIQVSAETLKQAIMLFVPALMSDS